MTEELCRKCGKNKAHPLSSTERCSDCIRWETTQKFGPVRVAKRHPHEEPCAPCRGMGEFIELDNEGCYTTYVICKTCKGRGSLARGFSIELSVDLDIYELWPAGEAPDNPTATDVAAVLDKLDAQALLNLVLRSQGHVIRNSDNSRTDWD